MPQMKPMIWIMMMMLALTMIILTIIINFFSAMEINMKYSPKMNKTIKWKW